MTSRPRTSPAETTLPAVKGGQNDRDGQQFNHEILEKGNDPFRSFLCSCGGAADYAGILDDLTKCFMFILHFQFTSPSILRIYASFIMA